MKKIYLKYKGKSITYNNCTAILVGFTNERFIGAVEHCHLDCSFRKFEEKREIFIEEEYKDSKYRYVWIEESTLIKQHPRINKLKFER